MAAPASHWDHVYRSKDATTVSWFERQPATSLRLLAEFVRPGAAILDVGAGESFLPDSLLRAGSADVTLLDVSSEAVTAVLDRLAQQGLIASGIIADVLSWQPDRDYQAWHDRAVFHFLVSNAAQRAYVQTAARALDTEGVLVLGTFAEDGPRECSGLPTAGFSAQQLHELFAPQFDLLHHEREEHVTPGGRMQPFTWVVLARA